MRQVPNGEDALRRAAKLVKSGGWLIVEETNDDAMADNGGPMGPGLAAFCAGWYKVLRSRGGDPAFGSKIEAILRSTGEFSEIHAQKVTIPVTAQTNGMFHTYYALTYG